LDEKLKKSVGSLVLSFLPSMRTNTTILTSTFRGHIQHADKLAKDDAFGLCALVGHCVDLVQKSIDLGSTLSHKVA
jgi:hypothetical protein